MAEPTLRPASTPGSRGFSLVEALVGLAILALALLMSLGVVWRLPRDMARLEANRASSRVLEGVLEGIRAGAVPLAPGQVAWEVPLPGGDSRLVEGQTMQMWMQVEPTRLPGLFEVSVKMRYTLLGAVRERTVETMAWQP